MFAQTTHLPLLTALVAIAVAGAWQYVDFRGHQRAHLAEHRRYGQALLNAAEGVAVRECRGGRYAPEDLAAALEETREAFGLQWLAIAADGGEPIAATGRRPEGSDERLLFEKRFEPLRPRPVGRGRPWGGSGRMVSVPEQPLTLSLIAARGELEGKLADDRTRALVTTGALVLAILLFAGLFWFRTRSVELRAALTTSRGKLESLETLRRLGAGLVHETKNPLGVVRGFAERIAQGRLEGDELGQSARAILDETDRTVARLDEFLLLSRPAELRRSRLEVRPLLDELATLLRPDLESAAARLAIHCDDAVLDADPDQIRRLLMNVTLNAIAALEAGGTVELTCERHEDGRRLVVSDDGAGVPEDLRQTLFEPYVTGRPGGTGLGLAIARRIATDHGFELRYEPRHPRGTRMILEVPRR